MEVVANLINPSRTVYTILFFNNNKTKKSPINKMINERKIILRGVFEINWVSMIFAMISVIPTTIVFNSSETPN